MIRVRKQGAWTASLVLLLAAPVCAEQQLIVAQSALSFVAKQENVPMRGSFRKFSGQTNFDPNRPEKTQASLDIDLNSIDLNSAEAESELKGKLWFDTGVFPHAKFTLSSVRPLGADKYEARGELSIKGITREVITPFSLRQKGGEWIAEGSFILKRLDFRIGEAEWSDVGVVADEVLVDFRLVLTAAPG